MSPTFEDVEKTISAATGPEDVFGPVIGSLEERIAEINSRYRKLCLPIHPDRFEGSPLLLRAQSSFLKLNEYRRLGEARILAAIYGDKAAELPSKEPELEPQTITTPKGSYLVKARYRSGDLSDLYDAEFTAKDSTKTSGLLKVVQAPGDNDLLENEYKVLTEIYPPSAKEEKFYRYLPRPYDSFLLKGSSGSVRRVNFIQKAEGYYSMAEVLRVYPEGLDYRDVVWMFKRTLAAIGYIHKHKNVVHGALLPPHVLVHPKAHGAKLVDWSYAVTNWSEKKGRVRAISSPYRDYYAPEILEKKPPVPQTDTFQAAKCAVALLGGNPKNGTMPSKVPIQIQAFIGACLLTAPSKRPDDAWALHEEFDELLLKLVGKPTYRRLRMPVI